MNSSKIETFYNKRVWLNDNSSPSTGSMVCYDGVDRINKDEYIVQMLKFSDCFNTVKLHKAEYDTEDDFLGKVILIRDELNKFIKHLRNKQNK